MSGYVVHFGVEPNLNLGLLEPLGCQIEACGTSIARLNEAMQKDYVDACFLSDGDGAIGQLVPPIVRSWSEAPLILIAKTDCATAAAGFDHVIAADSPPDEWLNRIRELILRSREIRFQRKLERQRLAGLREATIATGQRTVELIRKMIQNCQHDRTTVLVIDDDESTRDLTKDILESVGFSILQAARADAGADLFRERHDNIGLVILGLTWGNSGRRVFDRIRAIDSRFPVLAMGTDGTAAEIDEMRTLGVAGILPKPPSVHKLCTTVAAMLIEAWRNEQER